jgi:uncharacterized protein
MHTRRDILLSTAMTMAASAISPAVAQGPPLRLSTGATGGTFFEYGAGMARLIEARTGRKIEPLPSGGTIENLRRIESGAADIALAAMGPAYEAWTASTPPWIGNPPLRRARALLPMYETPFHLATVKETGLTSAAALNGKSVGVGPRGGSNEQIFQKMAEGIGIKANLVNGDPAELAERVVKRELDALFFGAGAPIPAFTRIANAADIVFISLDGSAGQALRRAYPYLTLNAIPAGVYRGQSQPVPTVALWNFVVARDELPSDVAEAIVRAVLSDPTRTRAIHPAAIATVAINVGANTFMPFHAGALAYLQSSGVPTSELPR